jgi:hypothetical protein
MGHTDVGLNTAASYSTGMDTLQLKHWHGHATAQTLAWIRCSSNTGMDTLQLKQRLVSLHHLNVCRPTGRQCEIIIKIFKRNNQQDATL